MHKVHYTTSSNLSVLYLHLAKYQKKVHSPLKKIDLPNSTPLNPIEDFSQYILWKSNGFPHPSEFLLFLKVTKQLEFLGWNKKFKCLKPLDEILSEWAPITLKQNIFWIQSLPLFALMYHQNFVHPLELMVYYHKSIIDPFPKFEKDLHYPLILRYWAQNPISTHLFMHVPYMYSDFFQRLPLLFCHIPFTIV